MRSSAAALALALCLAAAATLRAAQVHEEVFTIGPLDNGGIRGTPAMPQGTIGIVYWGDWVVLDAKTRQVVPRGEYFLHHIFVYERTKGGQSFFVSGSSDERVTWGPDLPEDGKYLYYASSDSQWSFSGLLTALTFKQPILIQYKIKYFMLDDFPFDWKKVVGVSYTSVPSISDKMATEEFGMAVSEAHVALPGPMESDATMVYAVGHVHVGGIAVNITIGTTKEELCYSIAEHDAEKKCYLECPTKCIGIERYNALDTISTCRNMNKRFNIKGGLTIYPVYDSRCGYTGLHGSVFAWFAPDDQSWFR